jgi:hypothetical protein
VAIDRALGRGAPVRLHLPLDNRPSDSDKNANLTGCPTR